MEYIDKIFNADCLEGLKNLPDESVDCCVTSPPYYGLRDYGTGQWVGGDPNCKHYRESKKSDKTITGHKAMGEMDQPVGDAIYKHVCPLCGAVREDKQVGLEETPEEYIERLVQIFREVRRVLKPEGTLWVNIGDTYYGSGGGRGSTYHDGRTDVVQSGNKGFNDMLYAPVLTHKRDDMKNKDLIGIPWMLAFALRKDGWYLRQDIIWHKPNPMPESVADRCTKSHEYIFLLAKSPKYYFDHEAIQEPATGYDDEKTPIRNKRDVWTVNVKGDPEAHFATYPTKLIKPCILAGAPSDGLVLDPFMGSGTTARVARECNRHFVGFELNPEYMKIIERKIVTEGDLFY